MAYPYYSWQAANPAAGQWTNPFMNTQQTNLNAPIYVQGDAGINTYPVAPNASVVLVNVENGRLFIKSADSTGAVMPLREFVEVTKEKPTSKEEVATKQDLEALRAEFLAATKKGDAE